jgi:hypothetical protein
MVARNIHRIGAILREQEVKRMQRRQRSSDPPCKLAA